MKKQRNVALKNALFATGKQQRRIAALAHISAEKLSHVIYGRRELDDDERKRLARVLGKSESELFPSDSQAVA